LIYTHEFLQLHYPKTAGKSLTRFFIEVWKRPVFGLISKGQFGDMDGLDLSGVDLQVGRGHENLDQSAEILRGKGIDIEKLRGIFVCIRNPYDLMVSNYFFMRRTYRNNRDRRNFELAATLPFEDYCVRSTMASPEKWMLYQGSLPAALRIIRFESLADDLRRYAEEFAFPMAAIPHINATNHEPYLTYITPRAEKAIAKQFDWIFSNGYYERLDLSAAKSASA
jgi:hypothetical protein